MEVHDPWEDGRLAKGRRTRAAILELAAEVAAVEGLEGLTIGRLAAHLRMSKSGLYAHFGSKEELQLAVNAAARERFVQTVLDPAGGIDDLLDRWIGYMRGQYQGGCYFTAVRAEFDARAPGPVRDAIVADLKDWLKRLAREVRAAYGDEVDAEQVAVALDALGMGTNLQFQLLGDPSVFERARLAMDDLVQASRRPQSAA